MRFVETEEFRGVWDAERAGVEEEGGIVKSRVSGRGNKDGGGAMTGKGTMTGGDVEATEGAKR